ncbi:hypothetical protein CPC08DRAFT_636444 [Agrocybe pediades]|nr:hypothetical protein CPC08DRAFT_636444 [Agrocybe pediades]
MFGYLDQLLSAPFPHLERFTFADDLRAYRAYTNGVKRPFLSPSLAPSLRDLRLIGYSLDAIHLPSSTITTLHLSKRTYGEISYANLVEELQTCQNLTELAIYNDVLNLLESYPDYIRCRLPSLKTLLLLGNMDMVSELLVSLDTPNLEELVVAPAAGLPDFQLYREMKDTSRVVQPPFPNLRRLILAPKGPTEFTEVMECASGAFPLIEQLTLANLYPGEFVSAFTSNNPLLFPKMVDLALTDVDATIADALYSIGAFRLAEGIPLRNFILDSDSFRRVSGHFSEGTLHFQLQEGNPWEDRRKTLLDKDVKDLYLGRRQ